MLNVGPGGLAKDRGHLPCHLLWGGTTPQGSYVAWVRKSSMGCLPTPGDNHTMEPQDGPLDPGAPDRGVHNRELFSLLHKYIKMILAETLALTG